MADGGTDADGADRTPQSPTDLEVGDPCSKLPDGCERGEMTENRIDYSVEDSQSAAVEMAQKTTGVAKGVLKVVPGVGGEGAVKAENATTKKATGTQSRSATQSVERVSCDQVGCEHHWGPEEELAMRRNDLSRREFESENVQGVEIQSSLSARVADRTKDLVSRAGTTVSKTVDRTTDVLSDGRETDTDHGMER